MFSLFYYDTTNKDIAAVKIQKIARGYLIRKKYKPRSKDYNYETIDSVNEDEYNIYETIDSVDEDKAETNVESVDEDKAETNVESVDEDKLESDYESEYDSNESVDEDELESDYDSDYDSDDNVFYILHVDGKPLSYILSDRNDAYNTMWTYARRIKFDNYIDKNCFIKEKSCNELEIVGSYRFFSVVIDHTISKLTLYKVHLDI